MTAQNALNFINREGELLLQTNLDDQNLMAMFQILSILLNEEQGFTANSTHFISYLLLKYNCTSLSII